MFTGEEDGAGGGMAGARGGLGLFGDELYFRELVFFFTVYQDVHGCLWLFEQFPEPFVLSARNSVSLSASMKIQRVWSLLSLIAVLVSLCPQNIGHTQQLSIFTHSAFGCITPRAWNTTIWTRVKTWKKTASVKYYLCGNDSHWLNEQEVAWTL